MTTKLTTINTVVNNVVAPQEYEAADLRELLKDAKLTDAFNLEIDTLQRKLQIPVMFMRFSDGNYAGMRAGVVEEGIQPIKDFYEAEAALAELTRVAFGQFALIDEDGVLLYRSIEQMDKMNRGRNLGYVKYDYQGALDMPVVERRGEDTFESAWGTIEKNDGKLEIAFVAARHGKYYGKGNVDTWKRAQNIVNACNTMMDLFKQGGISIWTGSGLSDLVEYYWLLWNLYAVDPEKATQISWARRRQAATRNKFYKEVKKEMSNAYKFNGGQIEDVAVIGGAALVDGKKYFAKTLSRNGHEGTVVSVFTFEPGNAFEMGKATVVKQRVERGVWQLVEAPASN